MSERQTAAEAVAAENDARRLAVQYAVAARDAEWRAAVERVRMEHFEGEGEDSYFDTLAHNAALDALLRAMEVS